MRYLITGITGFAGPNLANLLVPKGHEVVGFIRASNGRENDIRDIVPDEVYSKLSFVYGDLTDSDSVDAIFKSRQFDGVFHLAAQSHPPTSFLDPKGTYRTNVEGTRNIAEALKKHQRNCALMFCSTSEVYGAVSEQEGAITERQPIRPINPYGASKAISDVEVLADANILAEPFNMPFFVTRAFSHTGLRRGKNFSISSDAYQIARIIKGLQEPVITVGTLSSKRAVMDVRDCVNAYNLLMEKALARDPQVIGQAFNVGGNGIYTMGELLDNMLDLSGLTGKVEKRVDERFVRKIDIPVQIPDSTKLKTVTGWEQTIPMETTLRSLLHYWDKKIVN